MKSFIGFISFFGLPVLLSAQNDTIWFDEYWNTCTRQEAAYYRPPVKKEKGLHHIIDYYLSGVKQSDGYSPTGSDQYWEGVALWFYPDGDTMEVKTFKDGVPHGFAKLCFGNGKPYVVTNNADGERHGASTEYYYSGLVRRREEYVNGQEHGKFSGYFRDGKKEYEGEFKNGKMEGYWVFYYSNGKKKSEHQLKNGVVFGTMTEYNEDGTVSATATMEGEQVLAYQKTETIKGSVWKREAKLVNGIEEWRLYKNDKQVMEYFYKGIYRTGTWKMFSEDGSRVLKSLEHRDEKSYDQTEQADKVQMVTSAFLIKSTCSDLEYFRVSRLNAYYKIYNHKGGLFCEGTLVNSTLSGDWKYASLTERDLGISPLADYWEAKELPYEPGEDESEKIESKFMPAMKTSHYLKNTDTVFQAVCDFDGLHIISTHCSSTETLSEMREQAAPAQNEVLFFFRSYKKEHRQMHYKFIIAASAKEKLKHDVVQGRELLSVISQMNPGQDIPTRELIWPIQDEVRKRDIFMNVAGETIVQEEYIEEEPIIEEAPDEEQVFTIVEQMPEFPGGEQAMLDYIKTNLSYPEKEREEGVEGRVYIRFTVRKDGTIADAEIAKGAGDVFNKEAIRVITSMPAWKPGKQSGKPVHVQYIIPITFRLAEEE